jgi:hypothetical protein
MEYFVSVDRKAYHDWQIELLLESFKNNFIFVCDSRINSKNSGKEEIIIAISISIIYG